MKIKKKKQIVQFAINKIKIIIEFNNVFLLNQHENKHSSIILIPKFNQTEGIWKIFSFSIYSIIISRTNEKKKKKH